MNKIKINKMASSILKSKQIKNYINGAFIDSPSATINVLAPVDGSLLATVPMSGANELNNAVTSAKAAFESWSTTPIKERVQIFFRYKTLMEQNIKELAYLVHIENGKTIDEATAEVEKSIELTEFACSMPQLIQGRILEVSRGVECRIDHKPLGVVASIAPFNFPHMVPHWTISNELVIGNCMILKPSEQVPISSNRIAEMLKEAGLPDGVLNIVNGDKEMVEAICDHPGIEAVSFVGSTTVAKIVYK